MTQPIKYIPLLVIFLVIPSARAIFKYVPYPEYAFAIFCVFSVIFYYYVITKLDVIVVIKKLLNWSPLAYLIALIYAISAYAIYPIANARRGIGQGSTGDDAIIEPALTLLNNNSLYSVTLYDGAPISAGPGWIFQNAPFALLDVYWILTVFYICLTVISYRLMFGKIRETNFALILISTSLIFWELLVTGHDLIAIGFCFVLFSSLAFKLSVRESDDKILLLSLAIAVGVFATSRVVFILFPVLLAILFWKFSRKKALIFLLPSIFVAVALHGYYFVTSDYYQPLHLFQRGENRVGRYLAGFGLTASMVALIVIYYQLKQSIESWLYSVFVCLAIPLATISIGEFISSNLNFAEWEGANYLVPVIPILLFYLAGAIYSTNLVDPPD